MQGFSIPHKKQVEMRNMCASCVPLKALIHRTIEHIKKNAGLYNRLHGMLEVVKNARFQGSKLHTMKMNLAKWDKFELQKCQNLCNMFTPFDCLSVC